jgi:regulatory protein
MNIGISKEKALVRAQGICAKMEKSKGEIRQKLFEWKVEKQFHNEILNLLEKDKFIDENRFVHFFVRDKFRLNKWGKIKIEFALRSKEISTELIHEALESIDIEDYGETCKDLLQKKLKTLDVSEPEKRREKLIRFGQSRGFETNLVYKMVGELLTESELE